MQYKQASSLFWQVLGLILHNISPYVFGKVIELYKQKSKLKNQEKGSSFSECTKENV